MRYTFDMYKREHIRMAWLSVMYTEGELRERYFGEYVQFCRRNGYVSDAD